MTTEPAAAAAAAAGTEPAAADGAAAAAAGTPAEDGFGAGMVEFRERVATQVRPFRTHLLVSFLLLVLLVSEDTLVGHTCRTYLPNNNPRAAQPIHRGMRCRGAVWQHNEHMAAPRSHCIGTFLQIPTAAMAMSS